MKIEQKAIRMMCLILLWSSSMFGMQRFAAQVSKCLTGRALHTAGVSSAALGTTAAFCDENQRQLFNAAALAKALEREKCYHEKCDGEKHYGEKCYGEQYDAYFYSKPQSVKNPFLHGRALDNLDGDYEQLDLEGNEYSVRFDRFKAAGVGAVFGGLGYAVHRSWEGIKYISEVYCNMRDQEMFKNDPFLHKEYIRLNGYVCVVCSLGLMLQWNNLL